MAAIFGAVCSECRIMENGGKANGMRQSDS